MAHEIAQDRNGANCYYGRAAGWHLLGEVVGRFQTSDELLAKAGLDFVVDKRQLSIAGPQGYELVPAWATFSSDGQMLGTVGEDYQVLQHAEGFRALNALVGGTNDQAYYETAGVLKNGAVIWGLINLSEALPMNLRGDRHETYLLFSTSHDGSQAFEFQTTTVRVVCNNTLTAARQSAIGKGFKVYHTKNAESKFQDAMKALDVAKTEFATLQAKLEFLQDRMITTDGIKDVLTEIFRPKAEAATAKDERQSLKEYTQRGETRYGNLIDKIMARYESNDNDAFPEQRGTSYNLLQAITGYVDHDAENEAKGTLSALFGTGAKRKQLALETIVLNAQGMPMRETRYSVASGGSWQTDSSANRDAVADLLGV